MTTIVETKKNGQQNTPDRVDIAIEVLATAASTVNGKTTYNPVGDNIVFAAKSITFNQNTPKTPIQILGLRNPSGYARDPENRTFSLSELLLFNKLENLDIFTAGDTPFQINIIIQNTKADGTKEHRIMKLIGVEFDTSNSAFDANTSEYTNEMSGMFRKMEIGTAI